MYASFKREGYTLISRRHEDTLAADTVRAVFMIMREKTIQYIPYNEIKYNTIRVSI